ncbi:MAG: NERD domain-containing protein [Gammaproteobacteria bacterium]|nr:NERD domain-containing protein [Gammaproteobacteria bacterium]MDH3430330.1 NERD domain-containing protein [Gammaproteobacteria bacterium]MDH3433898.1 NERD domain-containing protein [Gammaproteobacteria bacterium]
MAELLTAENVWWPALIGVLVLLVIWFLYRRRDAGNRLKKVLSDIGYDRIEHLLIPNGDDGEIQIDHLLLTSQGLLIIDIKEAVGTIFGSDKMTEWAVISNERRYAFPNPQAALYDRIAAVRHIVRQVPVAGRILFLDGAEFTKGVPSLVTNLDELLDEFGEADKTAAKRKVDAFKPHWDLIRKAALDTQVDRMLGQRIK